MNNFITYAEIDAVKKHQEEKKGTLELKKMVYRFIDRNKRALYFAIASHITFGNCKEYIVTKDESNTKYW